MSGPHGRGPDATDPDGDRLRAAFRHGGSAGADPRAPDAEAFLDRVHRGTRRRRARRTGGAVAAAAVSVTVIAVGVSAIPPDSEPTDVAAAPEDRTGGRGSTDSTDSTGSTESPALPDGASLEVYDVEVAGDRVWALASRDCGRARLCPLVGRSGDQGRSWTLEYPSTAAGERVLPEVRHLDVSDDGQDAAVAGSGLAVSGDAGDTWTPVEGAGDTEVTGLAVGGDEAVAVLYGAGPDTLVTSPVAALAAGDPWVPSDAPVAGDEQLVQPFAVGDTVGAVVVAGRFPRAEGVVARVGGQPWGRIDAPCRTSTPLVTKAAGTLWYLCYAASGSTLATSSDVTAGVDDVTWTTRQLPGAGNAGLGPDGAGGARVVLDDRLFQADSSGEVEEVTGQVEGLDLAEDDYTYRSVSGAWMASFRGALVHATDGSTWERVPVR